MKGDKCEFSHENANINNVQPMMSIMSSEDVNNLQYTWVSRYDVEEIDLRVDVFGSSWGLLVFGLFTSQRLSVVLCCCCCFWSRGLSVGLFKLIMRCII